MLETALSGMDRVFGSHNGRRKAENGPPVVKNEVWEVSGHADASAVGMAPGEKGPWSEVAAAMVAG